MPKPRKTLSLNDLTVALAQLQQDIESALERIKPLIKDEANYLEKLERDYQVQGQDALTNVEANLQTSLVEHGLPIIYKQLLELVGPFKIDPYFNRLSLYHPANRLVSIGNLLESEGLSKSLNNFEQGHYHKYLIFAEIGDAFSIGEHDAWEALAFNREQPNEIITVCFNDYHMDYPNSDRVCVGEKGRQLALYFLISQIERIHEDGITSLEEVEQQEQEYGSEDEWDDGISEDLEPELPKGTDLHEYCIRWVGAIKEGNAHAYKNLIASYDDFREQIERSNFDEQAKHKSLAKLKAYHLKFVDRLSTQFQIAHSALTFGKKENVILRKVTIKEVEQRGITFHRAILHFSDINNSRTNNEFEIKLTDLLQTSKGWRLFGSVDPNP